MARTSIWSSPTARQALAWRPPYQTSAPSRSRCARRSGPRASCGSRPVLRSGPPRAAWMCCSTPDSRRRFCAPAHKSPSSTTCSTSGTRSTSAGSTCRSGAFFCGLRRTVRGFCLGIRRRHGPICCASIASPRSASAWRRWARIPRSSKSRESGRARPSSRIFYAPRPRIRTRDWSRWCARSPASGASGPASGW